MGRAMAVVLFTDLVGSTELRARVGEEAAEELRRTHDRLLTQAVEANSGRVVKGLGDGIMATFAGASDAVAAAVAIQQAIDRLNRSAQAVAAIAVRVGISAGDVTVEDDDVHGTPVIEAARLCNVATGGEILASEMVRWLARASGAAAFTPVGSLELKGLPDAVPAVRVGWEPLATSTVPMPPLLTDVGRVFVGRDAELERLEHLWKEAAAGERRVALLAGEPGVGKTRLAAELAARVHDEGATVLAGRCDEDLGVPYQPFVEALRHFVDHTTPDGLRDRLGRYVGELARLIPELVESVPDLPPPLRSDPETERYRLFDAVAAWLAAVSADAPLLVILDDLQWAATPTLLLLRHVARSTEPRQSLILGTYRDTELVGGHPLVHILGDLRRQTAVERFALGGLDQAAVVTLVEQASSRPLDDDTRMLARDIHTETEGNPFFVREVLRHLVETGAVERRDHRRAAGLAVENLGIPEGVRDVVGKRLARLRSETNTVLRMAAVLGGEFEPALLAAEDIDEEQLISALEEATAARLVTDLSNGRYRFAHALVRDTLYEGLSALRRGALHRRAAEAIEAVHGEWLDEYLPALAHHFARAGGDTSKAVEYATRAGDQAMSQLAFEAAAAQYEQAIGALDAMAGDTGRRRGELLVALGRARARGGDPRAADAYRTAAELARTMGDAETLAGAALGMADLWAFSSTVDDTRISLLEEARDALSGASSPVSAQLLARLATELYAVPGSWDRRDMLSAESIAVARRLADPRTLALSLHARNYAMWGPGGAQERLDQGHEIVALARQGDDREFALQGHAWCQIALLELGDVAGLDVELDAYERLADELRQPRYRWYAATRRAMRALLAGDLVQGERIARQARDAGKEAGEPDADNVFAAQMFAIGEERPCREALEVIAAGWQAAEATLQRQSPLVIGFRLMHLVLLIDTTTSDEAQAELEEFVGFALAKLDHTYYGMGWPVLAVLLSSAATRLSLADATAALYDLLAPYAGLTAQNCGAVAFHGSYSHHLGILAASMARWDEAEDHLTDAAAMHERMGARAYLARTRLEWARMLLTRHQPGDGQRAGELLGQALATAGELGLANVERRSVGLLQECP